MMQDATLLVPRFDFPGANDSRSSPASLIQVSCLSGSSRSGSTTNLLRLCRPSSTMPELGTLPASAHRLGLLHSIHDRASQSLASDAAE
eukprot:1109772-Rhodomonas_salina.1